MRRCQNKGIVILEIKIWLRFLFLTNIILMLLFATKTRFSIKTVRFYQKKKKRLRVPMDSMEKQVSIYRIRFIYQRIIEIMACSTHSYIIIYAE